MHKYTVLMLVTCLVASSLMALTVASTTAQAGYKPSVPQFTVKLVDSSYTQPPRTAIDEFTGKEIILEQGGYLVRQMTAEVTIKNQPFTPYINADGNKCELRYSIWTKGHFGEGWILLGVGYTFTHYQSDSGYTVVPLDTQYYDAGSQVDFRVKASVSNSNEQSDWSIQTITVSGSLPSKTVTLPQPSNGDGQPQYPDQTQPSNVLFTNPLFTLVVGVILGGIVVAVVMAFLRRYIKTPTYTNKTQTNTLEVRCRYA